jgi:hypothetical protein
LALKCVETDASKVLPRGVHRGGLALRNSFFCSETEGTLVATLAIAEVERLEALHSH